MTRVQKTELERSNLRSQIAAELDKEESERDHQLLESLNTRAQNLEVEYRSALLAEAETNAVLPDDTERERGPDDQLLELRERLDFANYVKPALAGLPVIGGAELEYNQEIGLEDNQFPLELLGRGVMEERTKRDGDGSTNQNTWVDRAFGDSAASYMGVTMRSVNPGVQSVPLTTAGGTAVQRGRSEAVAESTYTFGLTELKPTRASINYKYTREDALRVPGYADAILRDMRMALPDAIDKMVFKGDSGANENSADIAGFQTLAIGEETMTQAEKVVALDWLKTLVEFVDGLYANDLGDLRIVKSVGTARLWDSHYANSAADNQTLGALLRANGVMSRTREGIDTNTTANKFGAYVGLSRNQMGTAVAAVWNAGELVRDRYTRAKNAEIVLTLHYFHDFKLVRPANYKRIKYVA